jgi:putative ABC transport system permease protein
MSFFASFRQDLRWSLRLMRRNLGLTAAIVLSLALTLGANTATFSVLNSFLLRPLAIEDVERVIRVRENLAPPGQEPDLLSLAAPTYGAWRDNQRVFTGIAAGTYVNLTLTGRDEPARFPGGLISANFFPVLGIQPILGRNISPEEDRPGGPRVVMLSWDTWRQHFGGDPKAIGQTVILNGQPHTIIAVMPRGLHHPYQAEMWVPLAWQADLPHEYYAPARLKPGVTLEQARAEMNSLARRLYEANPSPDAPQGADLSPVRRELLGELDKTIYLLMAASAFVLLIACVNIANLLLAQGLKQGGEVAVRVALGATPGRLVRQVLTYCLLLALSGAALGTLLAGWAMKPLIALSPAHSLGEFDIEPRLDLPTLGFTFACALTVGLLFGMVPALRLARGSLRGALQEGGRTPTLGAGGRRLLAGLVVAEVALSLVLLAGAGLIVRSFQRLQGEDRGFDVRNVLSFDVTFPDFTFPEPAQKVTFIRDALAGLRELPGVAAVGGSTTEPLYPGVYVAPFNVEGKPPAGERGYELVHDRVVTPGYLEALRVPLLAGRFLNDQDTANTPLVAVVSKSVADRYWPGESALGKRVKRGRYESPRPWLTVVGVAGTLKETHEMIENDDAWYLPAAQSTGEELERMTFMLRVQGNPLALAPAARRAIHTVNRNQPVFDVMTMEQRFAQQTTRERFTAVICTALGVLGLVLAALGIYGVLSFSVNQRLREIGIRSALGAEPGQIRRLVLRSGLRLAAIGLVVGLAGALALTRLLSSQLYQVSPRDPVALAAALAGLAVIALLSSYFPARRAAKTDPVTALRGE